MDFFVHLQCCITRYVQPFQIMKKWQKITGIIALIVLAILNIVMCIFYLGYATSIYLKEVSYLVYANYIIVLFLFICLWRKGGKR